MQVALSLNNLAALLRKMSKVEQAEKLYMRSLSIREEALGPDHPQACPHLMSCHPFTFSAVHALLVLVAVCASKFSQEQIL